MTSFRAEEGGQDGSLTFDEASGQISGIKLQDPERRPLKSVRVVGNMDIGSSFVSSPACYQSCASTSLPGLGVHGPTNR